MFQPGDLIIYGNSGVFRVVEICTPGISGADKNKQYYKLTSVYQSDTVYTPVDTNVFMRSVITREQAELLIQQIPSIEETVYTNRNLSMLKEHYETSFQTHDCEDLVQLIKSIYSKNQDIVNNGKRLGQVDQRYRKRAEDLLYGELAVALDIPREQVVEYIEQSIAGLAEKV